MTIRERLAYWIFQTLKAEVEALRDGNTKIVLENQRLLDRLSEDDYIDLPESLTQYLPESARSEMADRRIRIRAAVGTQPKPQGSGDVP